MISTKRVPQKASFSIRDNLDPDLNVTDESDPHLEKQLSPNTSTDEGRTILIQPVLQNASFSIRDTLDPDSNVTRESGSRR
jgi:hypothetical protein